MASTTWEGKILEGPGKWDLMQAIMEGRWVRFSLEEDGHNNQITVAIQALEREDASNESWCIKGRGGMKGHHIPITQSLIWNVSIYYHSGSRKGHYQLTVKS
tara:strand:- start:1879 stop:2184 length:306 start_codon:yes stop_codon:yes gene_type:complete